jgi:phosphoribosyl 1,2-cyclic phosphodiesterase
MSLRIASLNSGSNGNCYYIGNGHDAVLVDAGISCRETERRMRRLGLPLEQVRAIFISHEHIDHIKGVEVLATRHNIPVYITAPTLHSGKLRLPPGLIRPFGHEQVVTINGMDILPFAKHHDAVDGHSFTISYAGITVGVYTDIGAPCEHLLRHFGRCHAAFLEANYDEDMLERGPYPYHLKQRIRGGKGHLSNRQALELLAAHRPAHMTHLLLAHLSKNNNSPELVYGLFSGYADELNIIIASRDHESAVYEVTGQPQPVANHKLVQVVQAVLF